MLNAVFQLIQKSLKSSFQHFPSKSLRSQLCVQSFSPQDLFVSALVGFCLPHPLAPNSGDKSSPRFPLPMDFVDNKVLEPEGTFLLLIQRVTLTPKVKPFILSWACFLPAANERLGLGPQKQTLRRGLACM